MLLDHGIAPDSSNSSRSSKKDADKDVGREAYRSAKKGFWRYACQVLTGMVLLMILRLLIAVANTLTPFFGYLDTFFRLS